MSDNKINQENNIVSGDQAGGSIDKSVHNYFTKSSMPSRMANLIKKFKEEKAGDQLFQTEIAKLKHYMEQVPTEVVIGLEAKLKEGGQEDILSFAEKTKELFTKKLVQYQFSESAQEIHAYLLVEVFTRFNLHVTPLIKQNASKEQIRGAVQINIIDQINSLLDDNVLDLYPD